MVCELPRLYKEDLVLARKQHVCCECHKPIKTGDEYIRASGIWDGKWHCVKTCMRCDKLRFQAVKKYPPVFDDEGPAFGQLREYIRECRR